VRGRKGVDGAWGLWHKGNAEPIQECWGKFLSAMLFSAGALADFGIGEAETFTTATTARVCPAQWGLTEKGH
jgi:hypothetical protein